MKSVFCMQPKDLMDRHFLCDGHADTLARVAFSGGDFVSGAGTEGFHLNLPKMRENFVDLQLMAVYIPPEIPRHQGTVTALWITQFGHRIAEQVEDLFLVRNRADLERARDEGGPHFMMTLEGAAPLIGDLDVLELFFRFGMRSIGLTHNVNNAAAGGCKPNDNHRYGLTDWGRQLLRKMEEMGVLVDTAHLSRRGFYELVDVVSRPFVNSHCCCAHFVDIERNLTDEQMKLVADSGGVVAITYVPDFLSTGGHEHVTSRDVFRHLERAVEICGIDHVALGSDFDGVRHLPTDIPGPEGVEHILWRMIEAGWDEDSIAKILGGNWYRVLDEILPD